MREKQFQYRVLQWVKACFGDKVAFDKTERNHRFLEESLELVQAAGCSKEEVVHIVEYVFSRPPGEVSQESAGVCIMLASLCEAHGIDMEDTAENELKRIWDKIDKVREKHHQKPNWR